MTRYFGLYFGAFGFTLTGLINLARGTELIASLRQGCIALAVFWLIGSFFGSMYAKIAGDGGNG
jgi:hypothetical protein